MSTILQKYFRGDKVIWGVILTLFIISSLAVYSSTGTLAYKFASGNTTFYFFRHVRFLFLGIILTYFMHLVNYRHLAKFAQILLYVAIPLLFLTLVAGTTINSAARWFSLFGVSFQPSDFGKFALIIFIAKVLAMSQETEEDLEAAFWYILKWGIIPVCVLILPANFSTAALLFITAWTMLLIGRINLKFLFASIGVLIAAFLLFLVLVMSFNYSEHSRIGTWKNRIKNFTSGKSEGNYQVDQAKIAIVTGGPLGKGPGKSTQRNILPHPYSDFIYAIIIEEYGLPGAILMLFLYLWLLYRTGIIVQKSSRTFPAFLAIGLSVNLVLQALVNMAVAVNLIPVTGQPLPFVSMGGTSILFTGVAFGVILSVSRSADASQLKEQTEMAN